VSTTEPYEARELVGPAVSRNGRTFRVAALDWGLKRNSLRLLHRSGCETVVFPALTPAGEILEAGFDGVFLSNGPGDPAATPYAVEAARAFLGRVPLFGICLGHQVVGRALGGRTYKLKFGHRGANQPVVDAETGRVDITSHNHGFALDPAGWGPTGAGAFTTPGSFPLPKREGPASPEEVTAPHVSPLGPGGRCAPARAGEAPVPSVETPFGKVMLTHWNLNDGTLEGLRCLDVPAFSVQYHPEAAPGPHDAAPLFERFVELMGG
jgi:carbamoyl-phosphate synthase small subunit